jgi:hypothetical protein
MQLAWDEGAIGALRDHFRELHPGLVPAAVERRVACLALERELRMRKLERRAKEAIADLRAAGMDVALLKGGALAATVYGAFVDRPMNDVDLLLRPEDAESGYLRMLRAGWARDPQLPDDDVYRTHHHHAPLIDVRGSESRLEIHRAILPPGHPVELPLSELWGEMRQAKFGGERVLVLEPNLHALHIAIHFAWSHTMRAGAWQAFRDLGVLARAGLIDWNRLVHLAERARAASCVYWTLKLARRLSALIVPDEVLEALAPRRNRSLLVRLERHFENVLLRRDASHLSLRLDRALWTMAIQPRQQGHGHVRPWLVSAELTAARLRHDGASLGDRLIRQMDRVARCTRYIARLLWP